MMWQPTNSIHAIKQRARLLREIREFFAARNILEVETPLLSHAGSTDRHIESMTTTYYRPGDATGETCYLQTSPEYAMKRLLASGSGSIYQICKAFRNQERGHQHNPEFTMLEWYQLNIDHYALMDDVEALLKTVLKAPTAKRISYQQLFLETLQVDPFHTTSAMLIACAEACGVHTNLNRETTDQDTWLQLLLSHVIEPILVKESCPVFIYDFPPAQAALARIRADAQPVAERFEVYWHGYELANGFHELSDATLQRQRFENDLAWRCEHGLSAIPIDEHLLAALQHGLPDCSGVAVGVDRLLMIAMDVMKIDDVLNFPIDRT